jgi:hypothetical protein
MGSNTLSIVRVVHCVTCVGTYSNGTRYPHSSDHRRRRHRKMELEIGWARARKYTKDLILKGNYTNLDREHRLSLCLGSIPSAVKSHGALHCLFCNVINFSYRLFSFQVVVTSQEPSDLT